MQIAQKVHERFLMLKLDEKQRDQLCAYADTLREKLNDAAESAIETGDTLTVQILSKVGQNLTKSEEICSKIEKQGTAENLMNATDNIKEVQQLKTLLNDSILILNTRFLASMYTTLAAVQNDLKCNKAIIRNPCMGIYQLDGTTKTEPAKIKKLAVSEQKPGVLHVSWDAVEVVSHYELQYDQQSGQYVPITSTACLLDSKVVQFPDEFSYNIRVRGINGCGPGEWSESAFGAFTILPKQPRKPLAVYANSSSSVTLVVENPMERECAKPITDFVIKYICMTDKSNEWTEKVFPVTKLEEVQIGTKKGVKIDLNWCVAPDYSYYVQASHRNKDGNSLPCEYTIRTEIIPPGEPVGLTVEMQTRNAIVIRWKEPETSLYPLGHYEVHWGRNGYMTEIKMVKQTFAVIRNLQSDTSYTIKVRAASKRFCRSEFSEISIKTKSVTDTVADVLVDGALVGMTETHLSHISWLQKGRKACDSKPSSTSKDIWSTFADNFQKTFPGILLSPFINAVRNIEQKTTFDEKKFLDQVQKQSEEIPILSEESGERQ